MALFSSLSFVKKVQENDDIYTFYFTTKQKLHHAAGQHGLFLLPGLYRPHPFSLSSSPDEEFVMFSTHTATGSRYKQRLLQLKPNDTMLLVGPIMNFTFMKGKSEYVFLAQGIGITPFRSMLVAAHNTKLPVTTTLVHVESPEHTFRQITQQCADSAFYPLNAEEFQTILTAQDPQQAFYISGSPRFIKATKQLLSQMGVGKNNIKTDSFLGY